MPVVLFAAVCVAVGVLISVSSSCQTDTALILLSLLCAAVAVPVFGRSTRYLRLFPTGVRTLLIALCLVLLGTSRASVYTTTLKRQEARLTSPDVQTISGTISSYRSGGSFYTRLGLRVDSVCVAVCTRAAGGVVIVTSDSTAAANLLPGMSVSFAGPATPLTPRRNPGSFDFAGFLGRRGFSAQVRVNKIDDVLVQAPLKSAARTIFRARERLRNHVLRSTPNSRARPILLALLLGDRSAIDEDVQSDFRKTGLMHLLAVSGLHVLVVGYSVYRLLGNLLIRLGLGWNAAERMRAASTGLVLLAYYFIAGQSISIFRALIMAFVFLSQHLLRRRALLLNGLGVAAMIVLVKNPLDLFDVGFQLSFGAVASLALLNPLHQRPTHFRFRLKISRSLARHLSPEQIRGLRRRLQKWIRVIIESVATSFAASLGTLPILVYHFGFVSFAGIILNVVAIPLTVAALSALVLAVVASGCHAGVVASWLGTFADASTLALIQLTEFGSRWLDGLGASLVWPTFVLTGVAAAGLAFYASRSFLYLRWKLVILVLAAVGIINFGRSLAPPTMDVVFLDVGQGDAIVVRTPDNHVLLVDAGPVPFAAGSAAQTVRQLLRTWSASSIDVAVATHPHTDHIGGLPEILESIPVGTLVDNGIAASVESWVRYDSIATSLGTPRRVASPGETIDVSPHTRVEILAPGPDVLSLPNPNESSVVLRITTGTTCLLLTGDVEVEGERAVLRKFGRQLSCDVIKVPHHGSRTSSGAAFVSASSRRSGSTAVVSVARRNRFGLPNEDALNRWRAKGARVLLTQDRAVWLRTDGTRYEVVSWR